VLVVDDYGHHPREIAATLGAVREAIGPRRLVVLFQPHRHSRTALLMDEFGPVFSEADLVLLSDIYAAGEAPREGVDAPALARVVADSGHPAVEYAGPLDDAVEALIGRLREGDVVLTLGAGSVSRVPGEILARLGGGR
jgi:UDP-N-acetylmuramate--alanine ligase